MGLAVNTGHRVGGQVVAASGSTSVGGSTCWSRVSLLQFRDHFLELPHIRFRKDHSEMGGVGCFDEQAEKTNKKTSTRFWTLRRK